MIARARITIPMFRRVLEIRAAPDGRTYTTMRSVPDGTLAGDVAIDIDVDAIVRELGAKALRNKTHRAGAMSRLIRAVASNFKREGNAPLPDGNEDQPKEDK